jgi:Asp-tRNA(Asn)/Glu-tRNA(Gln) amidotransferase A subunit family amidase
MARGKLTAERLVGACLERLNQAEPKVHAFVHIAGLAALRRARAVDQGRIRGPLAGLPIGVKDIIDTKDMPTECNSPIYRGHRPSRDADCVAAIRDAGGVVLGKTVTTEFAGRKPGPTHNPAALGHTPGGSSSGSAAAVAACEVPFAFGTQTGGSVIRPAAYCGVVGYKATQGSLSVQGVKPLAATFDTLGGFVREPEDLLLFHAVLAGVADDRPRIARRPRIGVWKTPAWPKGDSATHAALGKAARRLKTAGADVVRIGFPAPMDRVIEAHRVLSSRGIADAFRWEWDKRRRLLSPSFRRSIKEGLSWSNEDIAWAWRVAYGCRDLMNAALGDHDALLVPSATGEAPRGLANTGDAVFNTAWSLLGHPAITLPCFRGPQGLPLGVQLIGARNSDRALMAMSDWALRAIGRA